MFDYEPQVHCWIHILIEDTDRLKKDGQVTEVSWTEFTAVDSHLMTDFHVDHNKQFALVMNQKEEFCGHMSSVLSTLWFSGSPT